MLTEPIFLLAALGVFLTTLILVQVFLAIRHDHIIAAAPRYEEIDSLDRKIAIQRETLRDIEEDLRKRRAAFEDLAKIGAEVDALMRRRDELCAEWASLEPKRDEVRAIRAETEKAWADRQSAKAELSALQDELDKIKEKLRHAEDLGTRIEELERRKATLDAEVKSLEHVAQRLRDAEEEVARLQSRSDSLHRSIAEAEGRLQAAQTELSELTVRLKAEREAHARIANELTETLARLSSVEEALRFAEERLRDTERRAAQLADVEERLVEKQRILAQTKDELRVCEEELKDCVAQLSAANATIKKAHDLETTIATLEELVKRKRAEIDRPGVGNPETPVEDRLKELNTPPPVLIELVRWKPWNPSRPDRQPEAEALHRVSERFKAVGLEYHPRTQRAFHTAMKVNDTTQITVLAGISGTGKSQLPRQYAAGMGIGFLQVPVQPRWDSPQDLMGFYNYIEGRFRPTDMARALWQMDGLNNPEAIGNRLLMILLDEMNLARVEYYFSDFLSRLESRPTRNSVSNSTLRKDAEIELEIPMPPGTNAKRVFPGYNLLFAGTMNEDESTQSLSDKVVDRANVLRFGAPDRIASTVVQDRLPEPEALPLNLWLRWIREINGVKDESLVSSSLNKMSQQMRAFKRPFGHRLGRAVLAYVANYPEVEGGDRLKEALADQVEMRLLPKLRGVELDAPEAEGQFSELQIFVERDLRDEALSRAIGEAVETARQGSGQFVWTGVTR